MNHSPLHQICLAGVVLLSLVLPLMAPALASKNPAGAKTRTRLVWIGQAVGALGGALIVWSPLPPALGLVLALAGCAIFCSILRRSAKLTHHAATRI